MSIIVKLMTAVRGGARESLDRVVDANALRILEQEIFESEQLVVKSKCDLTKVVAEKIRLQREIETDQKSILNIESKTADAIRNDQQALAEEYADWIVKNESILLDMQNKMLKLQDHETRQIKNIKKAVSRISQYRRELRMAKATARSQSVSQQIYRQGSSFGPAFNQMEQSLQRIQQIQQDVDDQITAREDVEGALVDVTKNHEHIQATSRAKVDQVLDRIRRADESGPSTVGEKSTD